MYVENVRHRSYELLTGAKQGDRAARAVNIILTVLIALNIAAAVLQTEATIYAAAPRWFDGFECLSVCVFTIEYVLRLWSCTSNPAYRHPLFGRISSACTPMLLIDLASFAPFYVASFGAPDLRMLRVFRLFRILRIFKLARYSESVRLLGRVLRAKRAALTVTCSAGGMLLIVSASLMYHVEHDAQPEQFSSIPAAMWWGIETLTTVGYGDMIPKTTAGKLIGSFIAVLGIGIFAIPAGLLGAGFIEEMEKHHRPIPTCPHCGRPINLA